MKLAEMIGTVFGVGLLRPASGTWGSLAALPLGWVLYQLGGFPLTVIATVAVFFAGWWATIRITADGKDPDPSRVVVDEVVGQWVALMPVFYGAMFAGVEVTRLWPGWIAAFLFFRLFDIWKPGWVGRADRRHDPLGVMLDDVIAGVFAGLVVIALAVFYHIVIL
ncbi:MAG: phosphatidylglycerophosphatase A [Pseudomonadota bacterium]|nr:phosphatidylglycerophosphatase A [Pseudomonadota bacterium]MEC9103681.1 phosphatidylglycerophosphatase A [Pseudomonadota bacterium]